MTAAIFAVALASGGVQAATINVPADQPTIQAASAPPWQFAITPAFAAIAIMVGGRREIPPVPAWRFIAGELLLAATAVWCLYEVVAGDNLVPVPGWWASSGWWGVLAAWRFFIWRARSERRHLWATVRFAATAVAFATPVSRMVWPVPIGMAGVILALSMGVPDFEWRPESYDGPTETDETG